MKKMEVQCYYCNKTFLLEKREFNRQIKNGRSYFFCSRSCVAFYRNALKPNRIVGVEKECPLCHNKFKTMTGCKSATFCSRSCASRGSVTEKRRIAAKKSGDNTQNLISIAEILKIREGWKYVKLKKLLNFLGVEHEFEYDGISSFVFDLALFVKRERLTGILVEFDGPDHQCDGARKSDQKKTYAGTDGGWMVSRIPVLAKSVIEPEVLYDLLEPEIKKTVS